MPRVAGRGKHRRVVAPAQLLEDVHCLQVGGVGPDLLAVGLDGELHRIVVVGLGPAAGSLGVAMYSLGYMGKLFSEAFDGVDPEVLEAVRGTGLGRAQLARYALLPEAANQLLSQLLFMFEYNVRSSSIMGFVGAGGIGYYLLGYVQTLRYQELTTALLVTLVVVLAIDRLSAVVRAAFLSGRV